MNEDQLINILQAFKSAIEQLSERLDALKGEMINVKSEVETKVADLESTVFDEIINPANDYIATTEKNARFDDFKEKYGDRFADFAEPLKAFEGDDYDVVREAFNQYDDYEGDKADVDTYVNALVEELGGKLSQIKESLGIPEDTEIAVEQTEDGETVVTTEDGEVVASTDEDEENRGEVEGDDATESELDVEDVLEDGEAEDDPEEIAAFEEELKNYKD